MEDQSSKGGTVQENDKVFRKAWPGWVTVESEPAIFDRLLKTIGVRGASVEEIYALDDKSLFETQTIYGLIFLFRWKEEAESNQQVISCPEQIWFANQVVDNACASLALLNIVLNIPDLELGHALTEFKEFTRDFSPPLRGLALTNFDYLRQLHNTFARKSEMQESDMALMQNLHEWRRREPAKRKRKRGHAESDQDEVGQDKDDTSMKKEAPDDEVDEDCFHFIAYIYKAGHLWELDGLKKNPVRLQKCEEKQWHVHAAPHIMARVERYAADEIRFNLLAVVQDKEQILGDELLSKEKDLRLEQQESDPDLDKISNLKQQIELISADLQEKEVSSRTNEAYADRRRHDYVPFVAKMIEILHRKEALAKLLQ